VFFVIISKPRILRVAKAVRAKPRNCLVCCRASQLSLQNLVSAA